MFITKAIENYTYKISSFNLSEFFTGLIQILELYSGLYGLY